MNDYRELIDKLREIGTAMQNPDGDIMFDAADTIEKLSKRLDKVKNALYEPLYTNFIDYPFSSKSNT